MPLALNAALFMPMLVLQLFTWIVFAVIACNMWYRSRKRYLENHQNTPYTEFKKNLNILLLLFIFLGLPWLVIAAGAIWTDLQPVVVIIDVLQGPALFLIRVVRLSEARQFWRRLLLCHKQPQTPRPAARVMTSLNSLV